MPNWLQDMRRSPTAGGVIIAAALTSGFSVLLAYLNVRRQGGPGVTIDNLRTLLSALWLPSAAAWMGLWLIIARLTGSSPKAMTLPQNVLVILGVALATRLFVVFAATPQLSDDLWRYVHDGQTLLVGRSPYERPPAVSTLPVARRVNHPQLITIYQPTSQYVFVSLAAVARWVDPWGDRVFRLGFVLFDLALVGLLLIKLRDEGRSPWWATLYAWHPLAISEIAGSGHQDVVGAFFLVAALLCSDRLSPLTQPRQLQAMAVKEAHAWVWSLWAGLAFALALAVKPVILPLALPLAWTHRRRPGLVLLAMLATAGALLLLYLPFVMYGSWVNHLETVDTFVQHWRFNGPLHAVVERVVQSKSSADWICLVMLMGVLATAMSWHYDLWSVSGLYLAVALLLASTVHPWYLLWALPLVAIRFRPWVWVWSLTIAWSYAVLIDPAQWRLPHLALAVQYMPVYAVIVVALLDAVVQRLRRG